MTLRILAVLLASLSIGSCSRKMTVAVAPLQGGASAVRTTMQVQTANAIYAGEGDLEMHRLRQRLAADPKDLEARMALAGRYLHEGLTELALEHYRLAAGEFPDRPEPVAGLVKALRRLSMHRQAVTVVDAFLASHENAPAELHSWSGILHDEAGETERGEKAHRAALEKGRRSAMLHNNLGYNLLLQKRNQEAAAEFRKALEIDPNSEVARNNLGLALTASPREALAVWSKSGDKASAHNNMAAVLIQQGQYREARNELNIALGYKPDHGAALRNLKLVSELDGQEPVLQPRRAGAGVPSSKWRKFTSVLEKVFLSPTADPARGGPANGAVQAASNNE